MKKLIIDTSGINALAADPDCDAIIRSLPVAYHVGITETVIAEVAAHPDDIERNLLLDVMERLLKFGKCVNPYQLIIEQQAKAYHADPKDFEWRKVNVRFFEAEREVVVREIINSVSDETRQSLRQWDRDYRAIFSTAKPTFQKLFEGGDGTRPSLREVTDILLADGGAHLSIGANLMERATGTRPPERSTTRAELGCVSFAGRWPQAELGRIVSKMAPTANPPPASPPAASRNDRRLRCPW